VIFLCSLKLTKLSHLSVAKEVSRIVLWLRPPRGSDARQVDSSGLELDSAGYCWSSPCDLDLASINPKDVAGESVVDHFIRGKEA
jgi:hypothetical protein